MVYSAPRNWQRPRLPYYSDTATKSVRQSSFSVDNELLTTERVLVQNQKAVSVRKSYIIKDRSAADSEMLVSGDIVPFRKPESEGTIDELSLQGEEAQDLPEENDLEILVKHDRQVLFSKEFPLAPQQLRRLTPKVFLDARFQSEDGDD